MMETVAIVAIVTIIAALVSPRVRCHVFGHRCPYVLGEPVSDRCCGPGYRACETCA
jgi:hypothetical protein